MKDTCINLRALKNENHIFELLMVFEGGGGTDKSTGNHNINNTIQEECYKAYEKALQWALNN